MIDTKCKNNLYLSAISGGVDSYVATLMCKKLGYKILGITFHFDDLLDENYVYKIKNFSTAIGIEHKFINLKKEFYNRVLFYFILEYLEGRTPNPCVICNSRIKFGALLDYAQKNNIKSLITGHYTRISKKNNNFMFKRGIDKHKDQSYFLSMVNKNKIQNIVMPLGNLTKKYVNQYAIDNSLEKYVYNNESQDFCAFKILNCNLELIAKKIFPEFENTFFRGNIIDNTNKAIGKHSGIYNFTVGQRKKLKLFSKMPLYVRSIDNNTKNIYVTDDSKYLCCSKFTITNMNWFFDIKKKIKCFIKIRYNQQLKHAFIKKINERTAVIESLEEIKSVTPGQFVAIYNKNDVLLAGGIIS